MKRLYTWFLSRRYWLASVAGLVALFLFVGWLLTFRTASAFLFAAVWLVNLIIGIGAGYAALRFWYARHVPLIHEVGLFILSSAVDAATAVILIFVTRGVRLTWKFASVWFAGALLGNLFRVPLIILAIKGKDRLPLPVTEPVPASGDLPPQFWLDAFRQIVAEELDKRSAPKE